MRGLTTPTTAGPFLGKEAPLSDIAQAVPAGSFDGLRAQSMAMHVHSSFSEQTASMAAQLDQASQNAVDILWWTDHDHRMSNLGYRRTVHFTSLTEERGDGKPAAWKWMQQTIGPLTSSSGGGIVSSGSPNDPVARGSLLVEAQSTSNTMASFGFCADTQPAVFNERGNFHGQVWQLDVLPLSAKSSGYLELSIGSSDHPATGGRAAGKYTLSYRFGGSRTPGSRVTSGRVGIITVPVTFGQWNTVELVPEDDAAALWPGMEPRDFSTFSITLRAVSIQSVVSGKFDYLRFGRQHVTGDIPLQTQRSISSDYADKYPAVKQHQGVEMSLRKPHVNWFGGAVSLPTYEGVNSSNYLAYLEQQVDRVHASGGLASYNHPYGDSTPTASQADKFTEMATALLKNKALGTDILEVGYVKNGGADLSHHIKLWDVLSRNALFLTGNGTNDDHFGTDWYSPLNNWVTWVWAASDSEADLLVALRSGRAWMGSLTVRTSLDMVADDACPMGSVSIASVSSRQLTVHVSAIPSGGNLRVIRGVVDYAGVPQAGTARIASYSDSAVAAGSVTVRIDTRTSCFVRAEVTNAAGRVVSLSNPIWLLRKSPATGVPAARRC